MKLLGQFKAKLRAGRCSWETVVVVTERESSHPLMSGKTAEKLNLLCYNPEFRVNMVETKKGKRIRVRRVVEKLIAENAELFSRKIGKSREKVEILIDGDVCPVVQRSRKMPYNVKDRAEAKIKMLLEQDIIERVPTNEPRTWSSDEGWIANESHT